MKILKEKYPKGSYKGQQTDGRYIDGYLHSNLEACAKAIVNDMTFMAICFSSTLEVGTGKSVFVSQCGEAWTEIMKKMHGIDLPFDARNCVFRPKDLIKRAFEVPKYSFLWLDEWEDATYWSELGMSLRKFFRKCRQLNLFIMVIIPNWFQMPLNYAISRSVFAIDVRFEAGFERGFFSFYGFNKKRQLYIDGKRNYNYFVVKPDFIGRFLDGYGIPEKEYRKAKFKDMMEDDEKKETEYTTVEEIPVEIKALMVRTMFPTLKKYGISQKIIGESLGMKQSIISDYIVGKYSGFKGGVDLSVSSSDGFQDGLNDKEIVWNESVVVNDELEHEEVVPNLVEELVQGQKEQRDFMKAKDLNSSIA